jgi:hypothetical protein
MAGSLLVIFGKKSPPPKEEIMNDQCPECADLKIRMKRFSDGLLDAGALCQRQAGHILFLTERCDALEKMAVKNGWIQTVKFTGNVHSVDEEVSAPENNEK